MAFGRRARLRLGLVVPLLCCAADARSQAPSPTPGFAGTAHVNVVNVEVVVTDRSGVPATDLTREEFAAEIVRELREQYTIGYYPSGRRHDGRWRKVSVKVSRSLADKLTHGAYQVSTRGGYVDE